ncbi:MAG: hypothetical protein U0166_10515 [Acidobacteriota bacterium]
MGGLVNRHAFLLSVLVALGTARADQLVLKNGTTSEVTSARLDGDAYVVVGRAGRQWRVPASRVAEVRAGAPAAAPAPAPAPAPSAPPASGAKVFTNQDLPNGGVGDGTSSAPSRRDQKKAARGDAATERELAADDKKWESWRNRYERAQARVDAAQKRIDDLEAKSDQVNGDVETTSDGAKITGMRPGSGYNAQMAVAQRELATAQAALDRLREEAELGGVPPGVMR